MSGSGSGSFLSDDDLSHYSYSEVGSVTSTLADLLQRFTIDAQPDCTLKLRTGMGPLVVGADLTRVVAAKTNTAALVVKPAGDALWRRLRVDSGGTLTLRSRKLSWWVFTFDLAAHANPQSRTFDFSYRVATKWDIPRGEYRNKRRFELAPQAEARAHWSISYALPAIEGSMGTSAQRMSREVHADVGYAHLDIPRLELVLWPRGRPGAKEEGGSGDAAIAGGSGGSGSGGGGGSAAAAAVGSSGGGSDHPLPEYLRGEASGGTATTSAHGSSGSGSSGRRRAASMQQLGSHVACLSGRWWDRQDPERQQQP